MTVTDEGKGMSKEAPRHRDGMELELMEYRAKLIGTQVNISSAPDQGTTVSCSFNV